MTLIKSNITSINQYNKKIIKLKQIAKKYTKPRYLSFIVVICS